MTEQALGNDPLWDAKLRAIRDTSDYAVEVGSSDILLDELYTMGIEIEKQQRLEPEVYALAHVELCLRVVELRAERDALLARVKEDWKRRHGGGPEECK